MTAILEYLEPQQKSTHIVCANINGLTSISRIDEMGLHHKETSRAEIAHVLPCNTLYILTTA